MGIDERVIVKLAARQANRAILDWLDAAFVLASDFQISLPKTLTRGG